MSVLSATGFLAPEQVTAYTAALLDMLGTQNPLAVLGDTPAALRVAVERLAPAQLGQREAPGKWSTGMVIQHLADSELVGAFRLRMILAQDRPPIAPYDQDRWAAKLHYDQADIAEALERFVVLRRANLRLWAGASSADMARVGLHGERGEESLEQMRRLYAGHDLAHLHQLSRIRILLTGH
ncbi:MAG: DinB family protein [Gemmatimonadales bacterium]